MVVNPVNLEEIDAFLLDIAEGDERLGLYLNAALKKPILNDPSFFLEVSSYPDHPPAWLTREKFENGKFHIFRKDLAYTATSDFRHIADWIGGAMAEGDAWLENMDAQGRPLKLLRIGTLEQAKNMADKDMRRKANKLRSQFLDAADSFDEEERYEHIGIAKEFDNGCKIVRLYSADALDRESAFLGHCIGNGNYDGKLKEKGMYYYSLRDPLNRPHATFEVKDGVLTQLKGKENAPPVRKYMVMAQEFIRENRWKLSEEPTNTGLLQQDGEYYDIQNLPDNFTCNTSLLLWQAKWLTRLPEGLSIKGDLILDFCPALKNLPKRLSVSGLLSLVSTNVTHIPECLSVGKDIDLESCKNLTSLPDNLSVKGRLSLKDCPNLNVLPENLSVSGNLNLNNDRTNLASLPKTFAACNVLWNGSKFESVEQFRAAFEEHQAQRFAPPSQVPSLQI